MSRVFELGGGALGGARNHDPVHKSLGLILILAVCVVGIGTVWGVFFRVVRSETARRFTCVDCPFPHAAITFVRGVSVATVGC